MSRDSLPSPLPAPVATRLRRPSWKDPRLAVGVLLILGSTVAGGRVFAAADDSTAYYAARHVLTPGDPITAADLTVVRADLDVEAGYLDADRPVGGDLLALRTVGPGELLPLDALGTRTALTTQPVGIAVRGDLPAAVRKGARVDIWVADAEPGAAGSFGTPRRVVAGAEVAEISDADRGLGSTNGRTVHVLLSEEQLPQMLAAIANASAISVLPSAGAS